MAKVICVFNQKGGVGKTLTAVNLSAALALAGKRALLVDCDPQGSATAISGASQKHFSFTLEDAIMGQVQVKDIIVQSCLYHLKVFPAPTAMSFSILHPPLATGNEKLLKRMLDGLRSDFDFIVIDTPSSHEIFTVNAPTAADAVLIPLQSEYLAYRNLKKNLEILQPIKKAHNPDLKLVGILLTMYDEDGDISRRIFQSIRKHLGSHLFDTIISRDVKIAESPALEKPLVVTDVNSVGAKNYLKLADEVMVRMQRIN
ncbi:MAG: ParA family protein [Nanoarchaeota archaeon]|nr:ParA family protein [Nanoarchaeota archaeon]